MISMSKIVIKNKSATWFWRNTPNTSATWFGEIIQKIKNTIGDMVSAENTEEGSDAAELIVNDQIWFQIATTVKWKYSCAVLGLAACHVSQNWNSRYVTPASQSHISPWMQPSSLGNQLQTWDCPPATRFKKGRGQKEEKERSFTSIKMLHTHPARAGSTLKGKRKKKADTRRANGQKQRRGGRGTDGPPEPTYTAKRTWTKQRTHLNPTTHYGEARGEIRDQMGD